MQTSGAPGADLSARTGTTGTRTRTGTYLYCILPAAAAHAGVLPRGVPTVGSPGDVARFLVAGDLAAVVSDAHEAQYDIRPETIMAHEAIVEAVMQHTDVLPLRFGTVAASDLEAWDLLSDRHDELLGQLDRICGCVEFGLKVLWNQHWLLARILNQDATIQALRAGLAGASPTSPHEYFHQRLQLGQLTAQAVERESARLAQHVLEELEPLVRTTVLNPPLTEMMALNAAFLVPRAQVDAFEARERDLASRGTGHLTLKLAGPLPPYNFVGMAIG